MLRAALPPECNVTIQDFDLCSSISSSLLHGPTQMLEMKKKTLYRRSQPKGREFDSSPPPTLKKKLDEPLSFSVPNSSFRLNVFQSADFPLSYASSCPYLSQSESFPQGNVFPEKSKISVRFVKAAHKQLVKYHKDIGLPSLRI